MGGGGENFLELSCIFRIIEKNENKISNTSTDMETWSNNISNTKSTLKVTNKN